MVEKQKAFIAMPFATEFERIYVSIRDACNLANIEPIRADAILSTGPIINQIFDSISDANLLIAEVSTKNPNVYYEIALAHCIQKPTILIARKDKLSELPFDVRHHRVIAFEESDLDALTKTLTKTLSYVKDTFIEGKSSPKIAEYMGDLGGTQGDGESTLIRLIEQVGKEFSLTAPKLAKEEILKNGSRLITVVDAYEERVVFQIDINGIIRKKQKVS